MVISLLICPNIYRVPRGILSMRMNTIAERKPIYLKCLYNSRSLEWLTIKELYDFLHNFLQAFMRCLIIALFMLSLPGFFSGKHFFLIIYVCPCTRCFILKEKKVLISVLKKQKQNEAFKVFH